MGSTMHADSSIGSKLSDKDFYSKAREASTLLIKKLGSNLKNKIKESGEIEALDFCHENAIPLTEDVSKKFKGLKVSRKSHRPRRESNLMPEKYVDFFLDKKGESKRDEFKTVNSDGKRIYMKSLTMMPLCLKCHGSNINSSLLEAIKKKYPNDKAVGYQLGHFRGVIYIEEN